MRREDFRNRYNKQFGNAYGWDSFSKFLAVAGALMLLSRWASFAGIGLIIYAVWRSLSKNRHRRYLEAQAFSRMTFGIRQKFFIYKGKLLSSFKYKVFTCPSCSQKLRVPRKQGRIVVTCKKCFTEFKCKS
jgi:hypothetical protein